MTTTVEAPIVSEDGGLIVREWPRATSNPTPQSCSPAQGLIALFALRGITEADLLAAVESIADPAVKYAAEIALRRSTEWRRDSQTMEKVAQMLALSETDLDELFAYACGVSA